MRLYSLAVLFKGGDGKVVILSAASDLTSFGYFQRSSVQEFMDFTSKIIVERTSITQRASVKEQGVLVSDHEYPQRVAFTLLNKVLDDYCAKFPPVQWHSAKTKSLTFPPLEQFLQKYQNPKEADAMTRLQSDLDETKFILHNTIEAVLERGEKLDDLVEKSEGLSLQSKTFYKTARKTNSCCVIL